jgi:hypothetical protein
MPLLRALALCLVFGALCPAARAQFMTNIALNKPNYLTYEPVEATVTITNRSGSDVVMGGPNGLAWLVFEVTDPAGARIPPVRLRTDETIVFKSGTTLSRKLMLSDYFPFSEYGTYGVTANVYHPPSQQYYASNRARARMTEAKPFWEQTFGVPLGQPGAGQIRKYTLNLLRDTEHTYLYTRIVDNKTGINISTMALGTCIMVADPQVTLDTANVLHVLYMARPHIYAHTIVNPQGRLTKVTFYKEIKTNRPQLMAQADGTIGVSGGEFVDPNAPSGPETPKGRSIGDKPPGL